MEKKSAIKRAVKLLNDPRTMVGHVPEILIKTGIFDRKDIKKYWMNWMLPIHNNVNGFMNK